MSYDDFTHFDDDATQFTCFSDDEQTQFEEMSEEMSDDDGFRPLKVGTLLFGKYKILKVLGNGNFGMIYLLEANDASKKLLVVKEFFPKGFVVRGENDEMVIKSTLTERELKSFYFMKEIFIGEAKNLVKVTEKSHPNIVTFFALEENKNNTTYFIMNYEEGISLKEYLEKKKKEGQEKLSDQEIYHIALPLLDGLKQIHSVGVYHQDIKLENILIREDGSPILLDFGASVIMYDEEAKRYFNAATPRYAAIEQINVDQPPKINQTSDIYEMGVLLYKLITDTFPPKSKERMDAMVKGQKDPYVPLVNQKLKNYDSHLLKAVDKALQISQEDRFQNAQEFIDALKNKKKIIQYSLIGLLLFAILIYISIPTERGKLQLNVDQKGYDLYIDGDKVTLDKDKTATIETGTHTVSITKEGYIPFKKNITIHSDTIESLAAKLTPMQQAVTIDTNVNEPTIILNGRTLKNNIFTARYGETYKLKIVAKDHETIEKEIGYDTLFKNNFKLYYKLPVNKVKVGIDVALPIEMGITRIKVNNEPLRNNNFIARKGKNYRIQIENPYYEPLNVTRTFKELFENPEQSFVLAEGEGKVNIEVKPENVKITLYRVIDDQEIILNKKPYRVEKSGTFTVPASDKLFIRATKEGYKTVRSRFFSVKDHASVNKDFDLSGTKGQGVLSSMLVSRKPYHEIMIPVRGSHFKVSKYEINYDAFSRFLNASKLARENRDRYGHKLYSGKIFRYIMQTPEGFVVNKAYKNYPIAYISWYGAKAYVDWYSKVTGKRFALPTASEWTQMAKVGFDRASLFSHANFNSGVLFQCGMKTSNKDGVCDIFGNVFEWTATPSGTNKHVIKGGSFRSKKSFLVPQKYSTEYNQNANRSDLGFRIVEHK